LCKQQTPVASITRRVDWPRQLAGAVRARWLCLSELSPLAREVAVGVLSGGSARRRGVLRVAHRYACALPALSSPAVWWWRVVAPPAFDLLTQRLPPRARLVDQGAPFASDFVVVGALPTADSAQFDMDFPSGRSRRNDDNHDAEQGRNHREHRADHAVTVSV
jgi:hypothetical protein